MTTFYNAVQNTNKILNKTFDYNMTDFVEATKQICSMTIEELISLNEKYNANINTWLNTICFYNVFMVELLAKYGISSFDNIKFASKVIY